MKIRTPFTRARVRTHFTYHFWIYIVIAAASVFFWNMIYAMTEPRSPEDKRIDLYIQAAMVSDERAKSFLDPIWHETVPEMETVSTVFMLSSADEYAKTQLYVYIFAREGDIYLLSTADFKSYAAQGAFLDLTPFIESGKLNVEGLDLAGGRLAITDENGLPVEGKKQYGIPAYALSGFAGNLGVNTGDMVLSVTVYNGNEENVIKFLNALIGATRQQENTTEETDAEL